MKIALNNKTDSSIEGRAQEVKEKAVEGHWEMDTVVGSKTKKCFRNKKINKKNGIWQR